MELVVRNISQLEQWPGSLALRLAAAAMDFVFDCLLVVGWTILRAAVLHRDLRGPGGAAVSVLVMMVLLGLPEMMMWRFTGSSIGLKAVGMQVVSIDRSPLGWRQAFTRYIARCASTVPLGWGLAPLLSNPVSGAWHDRLAGTMVVRRSRDNVPR